jgi:hypothetical protein
MKPLSCWYEIQVKESLEERWSHWFSDMEIIPVSAGEPHGTIIRGELPDQAALYGLIGRIRDLNLTLIDIKRMNKD